MRKMIISDDIGEYFDQLKKRLPDWQIIQKPDSADLQENLKDAEVYYGWPGGGLDGAVCLKWIQTLSAGVDNLPLDQLRARGIYLTTASGVHANSISESIFGMMLSFSRQLFNIHKNQMKKHWGRDFSETGGQTEIHGKTIGIIGVGAIGRETARLAKAFNMKVLGYRRSGAPEEFVDVMYGADGLHALLQESDYVVNILPHTPDTDKLIGEKEFAAMKPTAFYINVGRGRTTDTDAIIKALSEKQISGAGLDCVDPEPLPADSPLWDMKNVFIGGHNSGATDRYAERAFAIFESNLEDYLAGRKPGRNLVDYDRGY